VFLVNSRLGLVTATPFGFVRAETGLHLPGAHLLPKLRCQFAEFLNQGSLTRLRILSPPTCVGLRYGHQIDSLEAFLGSGGSTTLRPKRPRHHLSGLMRSRICLGSPPTGLNHLFQQVDGLPSCVPPSLKHQSGGTGILTRFPSPTPFGLGLGAD
jgi:hypothetical protein